jgi:hypothetical protein
MPIDLFHLAHIGRIGVLRLPPVDAAGKTDTRAPIAASSPSITAKYCQSVDG